MANIRKKRLDAERPFLFLQLLKMSYTELGLQILRGTKSEEMQKRTRKKYSETFKLEVLRDYYVSGLSKKATTRKWGLPHASVLCGWIKRYPFESESLSLPEETTAEWKMKKEPKSEVELLKEENRRLRKALELEMIRSHAYKYMIELTEKEEGITILKKDGAKQ